jgi:hypothetical protein
MAATFPEFLAWYEQAVARSRQRAQSKARRRQFGRWARREVMS